MKERIVEVIINRVDKSYDYMWKWWWASCNIIIWKDKDKKMEENYQIPVKKNKCLFRFQMIVLKFIF